MATVTQFVDSVFYRISKGKPQAESGVWRVSIESTMASALQRLAERVASNHELYPILVNKYELTLLPSGEVSLSGLTPTLLLSKAGRMRWTVTATGVTHPIQMRRNYIDLTNPSPNSDYYFYTVFNKSLMVRTSAGVPPIETSIQLYGNYVPAIDDASLSMGGQLFDDLVDIGEALTLETTSQQEVIRQAESPDGMPEMIAQEG